MIEQRSDSIDHPIAERSGSGRKPWRKPEVEILPLSETQSGSTWPGSDASFSAS